MLTHGRSAHARCRADRRGTALVEVALLLPVFALMLFGTLEMGALMGDYMLLTYGTQEAVRAAATGGNNAEIQAAIESSTTALRAEGIDSQLSYRMSAGPWMTLVDSGDENSAPPGSRVRAILRYDHHFLAGNLLSRLTGEPPATAILLEFGATMRRE